MNAHKFMSFSKKFYSTVKRKFPVDPKEADKLPIFEYGVSKATYNRVFVWGYARTGALGVQFQKAKENKQRNYYLRPKRLSFGEKFEVTHAACGFGFSVFAVNSDSNVKIYGTGLNTDSQIGYHAVREGKPLGIIFFPQPIHLPIASDTKILKISAGRAHMLVLTDAGLFCLGNNAYGQCGRTVVSEENYSVSNYINHVKHIEGKAIVDVEAGQDHSLALTEDGCVYSCGWGADGQTGLGHYHNTSLFKRVKGDISNERIVKVACRCDFVLALNEKGEVFGWGNTEYAQMSLSDKSQQVANPTYITMLKKFGKIIDVAAGGSFCSVLNDNHELFMWGYGLLGTGPNVQSSAQPIQIPSTLLGLNYFQPENVVTSISCGVSHMAAVTKQGDLYMWGRNRNCCLGLGDEKDQYFPLKVPLSGYAKSISCGLDHNVVICKPFI